MQKIITVASRRILKLAKLLPSNVTSFDMRRDATVIEGSILFGAENIHVDVVFEGAIWLGPENNHS